MVEEGVRYGGGGVGAWQEKCHGLFVYSETTPAEIFDVVLGLLTELGRHLFKLFQVLYPLPMSCLCDHTPLPSTHLWLS